MAEFEKRFIGKQNAGLRALIRKTVKRAQENDNNVISAVKSLAGTVALTESGRHTLGLLVKDFIDYEKAIR